MPISEETVNRAKAKAKTYLEYSIYTLAITLGIDPGDLSDGYVNPIVVDENRTNIDLWQSHEHLKLQIDAYSRLD